MMCRSLQDSTLCKIRDIILATKKYDAKQVEKFANVGTIYLTTEGFNVVKWIWYQFNDDYCSFELSDGSHSPDKLRLGFIEYKKNELQPSLRKLERWINN